VALALPELEHEPPEMEQVEAPGAPVKKNGNENLWPDAGMAVPVTASGPAPDEEDMIEIREAEESTPGELSSTAEIDRILRTIGRGLSPEYVEPELLPLDLNELMQRPIAPPPFIKEEKPAEDGAPAPAALQHTIPPAMETTAPQLPLIQALVTPENLPPAPAGQDFEATGGPQEEEIFSPIVDLRKTRAAATTSIDQTERAQEHTPVTASPVAQQPISPPVRQEPIASISAEAPPAAVPPSETPAVSVEAKGAVFAQNLYDIPREIIPEYVDVAKMEKQVPPPSPIAPTPVREAPAATPVAGLTPGSETPAPVDRPAATNWSAEISNHLRRLASARQIERPKLVVIGRDGFHISAMVKNLLGPESSLRKVASATFQHLELGERKVGQAQPFDLIGISIEQQFTKLLATVAKDLAAYIMLVEAHRQQELSYLGYLLNTLRSQYRVPAAVAVVRSRDHKNLSHETVRDLLNAETEFLEECNPMDAGSVAVFLQGLTNDATLARWSNPA
jgi:hypothetical protein